ncbi:MAG: DUF4158 domain-containing protein [Acidobacteria bacterium]|nr:DUF4158 domain-containing protein [Acidobacteriota bacterium]
MPVSDPDVSRPRLIRDATFLEADRQEIALRRGPHNRLGFAYQVAFVRVLGRFPQQAPLEIDGEILRFAALQLGADAEAIHAYAVRQQTVSEHQQRIGEYLRLRTWDTAAGERLARFLEDEALRIERTASLLARGARLAPRRARSRAVRFGVASRDRGCPKQGPDAADATHGRAPVGTDARPS